MKIQFRSSYQGVSDYDVYLPRIVQRCAIIEHGAEVKVRLTEFGEQAGLKPESVSQAYADYQAQEHEKFLIWCAKNNFDPAKAY